MKTIAQGAEAILSLNKEIITKNRIKKSYRIPELDEKLRKQRTKKETKLLEKASKLIPTPRLIKSNDKDEIQMEFIEGKKLSEHLDSLKNNLKICEQIGNNIAKLHDSNIIHGDLTTSNMILKSSDFKPNKKTLQNITKLKKLNFPENQFVIFGSAPIGIRGIRETDDLDIIVKKELWDKLVKKYPIKRTVNNNEKIEIGDIEIFKDWAPWFKNPKKLIEDSDNFEGINFVKLKYVIEWKKAYGREKDKEDITLINKYLNNESKVHFIDYGLGYESSKIEDKAVDLHLIKQALEAKHYKHYEKFFSAVLKGYKISKNSSEVIKRLEAVEKRGRYKTQF